MAEFSESRHQAEFNQSRVLEDCLAVTFALLCNCPQFSSHHHSKSHFWHRYMKPKWLSFNPTYDASSRFQNHCQLSSIWSMSDVLSCGYMALLAKVTLPQRAPKPMHGHQGIGPPNSASHGPHACLHDPQCLSMECWTGPWSSQSQESALLDCHKVQWLCQHVMFLFHAAPKPGWMHLTVRLDNLTMRRDIIHTKWSKPLSDGPKSYQSTGAWWSTRGYSQEQKPAPSSHHRFYQALTPAASCHFQGQKHYHMLKPSHHPCPGPAWLSKCLWPLLSSPNTTATVRQSIGTHHNIMFGSILSKGPDSRWTNEVAGVHPCLVICWILSSEGWLVSSTLKNLLVFQGRLPRMITLCNPLLRSKDPTRLFINKSQSLQSCAVWQRLCTQKGQL